MVTCGWLHIDCLRERCYLRMSGMLTYENGSMKQKYGEEKPQDLSPNSVLLINRCAYPGLVAKQRLFAKLQVTVALSFSMDFASDSVY